MQKIYEYFFGDDYILVAIDGKSRFKRVINNKGVVGYNHEDKFRPISESDNVKWLTCKKSKYINEE